jgi:hypothetical protein
VGLIPATLFDSVFLPSGKVSCNWKESAYQSDFSGCLVTMTFCNSLRGGKQFIPFTELKIKLKIQNEEADICNETQYVLYDVEPEFVSIISINLAFQWFKISRRYIAGRLHCLYFSYRVFSSVKNISISGQLARTQLLVLRSRDIAKDRLHLLPK